MGRRLSRLSDAANQVLACASVVGRAFDVDVVGAMVAVGDDELLAAVDEAAAAALIAEVPDRRRATFAFSHALVRQTLYEELSLPRKQRLHAAAATALEALPPSERDGHVAALAAHYRLAGAAADPQRALEWSLRAAASAAAVLAWEEAASHVRAALEVMHDHGIADDAARARLLEQLGDLEFIGAGERYDRAVAYLEEALPLYERLGDRRRTAQVHSRLGRALSSLPGEEPFEVDRAFEHYRAAEAVLAETPEQAAYGYLLVGVATACTYALDLDGGLSAAGRALELGERLGNEGLWLGAAAAFGWHTCAKGRFAEGLAFLEDAWTRADRIDHGFAAFHLASYRGGWAYGLGDLVEATAWFEGELAKPRTAQAVRQRRSMLSMLAELKLQHGDRAEARAIREEAPATAVVDLLSAFYDGDFAVARTLAQAGVERFAACGAYWQAGYSAYWLGRIAFAMGDAEASEQALRRCIEYAQGSVPNQLIGRATRAVRLALADSQAAAEEELGRCRTLLDNGEDHRGNVARVAVADAAVAALRGERERVDSVAAGAVEGLHRYGLRVEGAGALRVWAWCLRRLGDDAAAADREARAQALFAEFGMGDVWLTSDAGRLVVP